MRPPLSVANAASREANAQRAEWMVGLAEGEVTVTDLIKWAATVDGKPLLRITLRQLLLSQPGWGAGRTARALDHVRSLTGSNPTARQMTIGWLLDSRSGGRRLMAWCDALTPQDRQPWAGFPFAPETPAVTA